MAEDIRQEFSGIDLNDSKRDRRLLEVAAALAKDPQRSICAATGGWAETMGAYRLLNNEKVTPAALLAPHQAAVVRRCEGFACVVVVQDTTEMDFTTMKSTEGLGPLNEEKRRGFYLHGLYTVSEQGLPLGVLGVEIILRDDANFRIKSTRKNRPIEDKESYRWVEGYRKTCELARAVPDCEVFSVSDREGDIFEVFEAWRKAWQKAGETAEPRAEWLIRANQDRALLNVVDGDPARLFGALEAAPDLGQIQFDVAARAAKKVTKKDQTPAAPRSARKVVQSLRAIETTPRPPHRPGGKGKPVSIYAVLAQEIDPPPGEQPLLWILLTSKPVRTAEEAERMLKLYLRRRDIEVFHKVLKSGCKVEEIQLKTALGTAPSANDLSGHRVADPLSNEPWQALPGTAVQRDLRGGRMESHLRGAEATSGSGRAFARGIHPDDRQIRWASRSQERPTARINQHLAWPHPCGGLCDRLERMPGNFARIEAIPGSRRASRVRLIWRARMSP